MKQNNFYLNCLIWGNTERCPELKILRRVCAKHPEAREAALQRFIAGDFNAGYAPDYTSGFIKDLADMFGQWSNVCKGVLA